MPSGGVHPLKVTTEACAQAALGIIDHPGQVTSGGGAGRDDNGERDNGGDDGAMEAATNSRPRFPAVGPDPKPNRPRSESSVCPKQSEEKGTTPPYH